MALPTTPREETRMASRGASGTSEREDAAADAPPPVEGSLPRSAPGRRRPELVLLLFGLLAFCGEFLLRYEKVPLERANWMIGDCRHYRDVTRALLEAGTVDYSV